MQSSNEPEMRRKRHDDNLRQCLCSSAQISDNPNRNKEKQQEVLNPNLGRQEDLP